MVATFSGPVKIRIVVADLAGNGQQVLGGNISAQLLFQFRHDRQGFLETAAHRQLHLDMHGVDIDVREQAETDSGDPQGHHRDKNREEQHQRQVAATQP